MAKKIGPKVGQIDIHKEPKSSFGEVVGGIVLVLFVLFVVGSIVS